MYKINPACHEQLSQLSKLILQNTHLFFDDRLSRFNLATSYIELMILMKENDSVSQKGIADQLSLAPSTITRFVDKLKKEGYLTKKRDGRNMTIELTEKGREMASEMEKEYQSVVNDISDLMGDKYLETVGKLLNYGSEELEKEIAPDS